MLALPHDCHYAADAQIGNYEAGCFSPTSASKMESVGLNLINRGRRYLLTLFGTDYTRFTVFFLLLH